MAREPAASPHDVLFKRLMGDARTVDVFLREQLPREISDMLAPAPPELMPGSFVDDRLRQYHTDVLYRLRLRIQGGAEREVLAFLLLEHKSASDVLTPLQLLRYQVRIWEKWIADKHGLPLPPVLTLVVHQGPRGWSVSRSFRNLFGTLPEALLHAVPDFTHGLVDLAGISDDELSREQRLRAFLMVMKYALRPDLPLRLEVLLDEVLRLDLMEIRELLVYIEMSPVGVGQARLIEAIDAVTAKHGGDSMDVLQALEKRALERGKAEGMAKGKVEGKAELLLRLLAQRFGRLPRTIRQRVLKADNEALDRWTDHMLGAPDLESLLDS